MALSGRTVVFPLGLSDDQAGAVARRLAGEGAAIVLVTREDSSGAGQLAASLAAASARTAVVALSGDEQADLDALVELLGELFS